MEPLVSICIPNFNKASFIEETINSVFAQTYSNIELIIIDDCSTDNSLEVVKRMTANAPVKTILIQNSTNQGVPASLNKGISEASGKYYQMIGSDDIIFKDKINKQVQLLESLSEEYAFVFGKPYRIDIKGEFLEHDYFRSIGVNTALLNSAGFEDLLKENFVPSSSHLVRMSALRNVGLYDEQLRAEDWDLWLRLSMKYKFLFTDEYDSLYRIVPSSLSNNPVNTASVYASYAKTILKYLNYSNKGNKNIAITLNVFSHTVYKNNGNDALFLLKKNFWLNKTVKSAITFILCSLGIKHKYYELLKKKFSFS